MSLKRRLIGYLILIAITVSIFPFVYSCEIVYYMLLPIIYGSLSYILTKNVILPNLLMWIPFLMLTLIWDSISMNDLLFVVPLWLYAIMLSLTICLSQISQNCTSAHKRLLIYIALPCLIVVNTIGMIWINNAILKNPDWGEGVVVSLTHWLVALIVLIIYGVQSYKATARVILPNIVFFIYLSIFCEICVFIFSDIVPPKNIGEYLSLMLETLIFPAIFCGISLISSLITMLCTKYTTN